MFFGGENEFDENREVGLGNGSAAAPFRGHLCPCFAQCFSGKWTGCNSAIHARKPRLAQRFRQIGFFREERRERACSPEARAENSFHPSGPGPPGFPPPSPPR